MSDKEVRFGIANTALWATATTDASNGSVNGGHDALTAGGGAVPLVNMFIGEVIFGGVGSGLYGMFFYVLIAVFIAGLMVGRTPEYLGKKIEAREIKLAAVGALFVPTIVLVADRARRRHAAGLASIFNPGAHGFTEALYAYTSQTNNNGSAFAGYGATNFSALARLGRDAGSGASCRCSPRWRSAARWPRRRPCPPRPGTFRTDGADVRRAARRRDRPHRRPDDLPGAHARPDRGGADAVMLRDLESGGRSRSSLLTLVFGFAYPLLDDRLRAARVLEHKADGSLVTRERQCRRLAAGRAGVHAAALLPRAAVGDDAAPTTPARRRSPTSGRRTPTSRRASSGKRAAILKLERPYNPGLTIARHPGRRGHDVRLGHRPGHLSGQRAAAGAPHRRRAPAAARHACRT